MTVGKEISKEELLKKEKGYPYACYNPITDDYKFQKLGIYDIATNKYSSDKWVFFEVDMNDKKEEE